MKRARLEITWNDQTITTRTIGFFSEFDFGAQLLSAVRERDSVQPAKIEIVFLPNR